MTRVLELEHESVGITYGDPIPANGTDRCLIETRDRAIKNKHGADIHLRDA